MPPLPETLMLGKIYAILEALYGATGCPGSSQVREGGGSGTQVAESCLPTSTVMRKRDGVDCSQVQFFLGWWPLLFGQQWWGHIWYRVYGSPAVCYWRESVISRILDYNQRPVVPGVLDHDSSDPSPLLVHPVKSVVLTLRANSTVLILLHIINIHMIVTTLVATDTTYQSFS
jgi:hypothetical protein